MDLLLLLGGLATLILSGEFLVKGAVGIARKLRIPAMVIGLTVVAFGTSAPELIVSLNAAYTGNPEIAIGNVVGSNIANIALVLGVTACIYALVIESSSKKIDWPFMMLGTVALYAFMFDGMLERWEGAVMFVALILFISWLIRKTMRARSNRSSSEDEGSKGYAYYLLFTLAGFVGLYFGSEWMLDGAVGLAEEAGMPKHLIGVTIIAVGTSVPELVTSVIAAIRKETDISIGNLIGSNIFNIMAVLGLTSIVHPIPVEQSVIDFDMRWVLGISAGLLPLMIIGKRFGYLQGITLLAAYFSYIGVLIMSVL